MTGRVQILVNIFFSFWDSYENTKQIYRSYLGQEDLGLTII